MKNHTLVIFIMFGAVITLRPQPTVAERRQADLTEAMKQSIVYLETFFYGYEQSQPWRHKDISEKHLRGLLCQIMWAASNSFRKHSKGLQV